MSLIENLNNLEISIINAKQTLVNNINNKGGEANVDETLTEIANKVLDIPSGEGGGGGNGECALDFSIIGYDTALSNEVNAQINADIAYSKSLYDAWNPSKTSAYNLYKNDTQLVYAPNIDTSNVDNMYNMFYGCSKLTSVPQFDTSNVRSMQDMFYGCGILPSVPLFNTSNVTEMSSMFTGCRKITTVPLLNTSNVTDMGNMFNSCTSLTSVPQFDTSNVTDMSYTFSGCTSLTSVPQFDTSNVTTMYSMFSNCSGLTSIPQFDTSNVTSMYGMVNSCKSLTSLPLLECGKVTNIGSFFGYSNLTTLTTLGGFKDLKIDWNDSYCLSKCPNLTYESVMNVINNLYDFRGNGDETTTRTLKLHSNSLALLNDDDKAVATSKGWILS